jgi:hypothetical protein
MSKSRTGCTEQRNRYRKFKWSSALITPRWTLHDEFSPILETIVNTCQLCTTSVLEMCKHTVEARIFCALNLSGRFLKLHYSCDIQYYSTAIGILVQEPVSLMFRDKIGPLVARNTLVSTVLLFICTFRRVRLRFTCHIISFLRRVCKCMFSLFTCFALRIYKRLRWEHHTVSALLGPPNTSLRISNRFQRRPIFITGHIHYYSL